MNSDIPQQDRDLLSRLDWRSASALRDVGDRDAALTALASWLDGGMGEAEGSDFEAELLRDGDLLTLAVAVARDVNPGEAPSGEFSPQLVARLQALVPGDRRTAGFDTRRRQSWFAASLQSIRGVGALLETRVGLPFGGLGSLGIVAASLLVISVTGVGLGFQAASLFAAPGAASGQEVSDVWDSFSVGDEIG